VNRVKPNEGTLEEAREASKVLMIDDPHDPGPLAPLDDPIEKWGAGRTVYRRPEVSGPKMAERRTVNGSAALRVLAYASLASIYSMKSKPSTGERAAD